MSGLKNFAALTPSLMLNSARPPSNILSASILGFVCVNALTLLILIALRYRHLLFADSYPSKASLSPVVHHVEPPAEKEEDEANAATEAVPLLLDIASPFPDLSSPVATEEQRSQIGKDKELYHALQNMEDHPGAADRARGRLVELLDQTMYEAQSDTSGSILSIDAYSPQALRQFFHANHTASSYKYEAYVKRRRAGGPREMFPTFEYAVQWLKLAACVKYVDGGWVGNILNLGIQAVHPSRTSDSAGYSSDSERKAAKLAWQVVTEEFGDGDLAKNHVYLYYELIRSIDPSALPGHMAGFDGLAPTEGSHRCWTAAVAQQCIGLMAGTDDFFPEALGFNMAYETLPYHLLVTSKELRELKIDDYYFALHITIDNPDSGHAALGRVAVETFLDGVRERDGEEAMQRMWKRVQAGCVLADGLPTTPASPIEHERLPSGRWVPKASASPLITTPAAPTTPIERAMCQLLTRKSLAAEKMHCSSRIRIDGHTVEEWLDPNTWTDKKALQFLRGLGRKRPWVVPGDSKQSRLVRELEWGGRMFGAFSAKETELVRVWIAQLGDGTEVAGEQGAYERFVGVGNHLKRRRGGETSNENRFAHFASQQLLEVPDSELQAVHQRLHCKVSSPVPSWDILRSTTENKALNLQPTELAALWLTLPSLLEHLPLSPSKLASPLGMCAIRVLRSFSGFPDLHAADTVCAGMDHFAGGSDIADGAGSANEGAGQVGEDTRGWHEVGSTTFSQIAHFDLPTVSAHVQADSRVALLCADMLALRSRPYAHAEILLGSTLAGVLPMTKTISALAQQDDMVILRRIQEEIVSAIQEYFEHGQARSDGVSEEFMKGYELFMTV